MRVKLFHVEQFGVELNAGCSSARTQCSGDEGNSMQLFHVEQFEALEFEDEFDDDWTCG